MHSTGRGEIQEDVDALRAVVSRIQRHSFAVLTTPERLGLLAVLEQEARRLRTPEHALISQLVEGSDSAELGGKLSHVLADRLRITRGDAGRRIAEAADLGPRRALTGEALPPLSTGTATAQRDGAPARKPKPIWPSWPPSIAPTSWPNWPNGSMAISTPMAPTATRIARANGG